MQDCAGIEVVIEASWRERIKRRYVTAATTKSTASRPSKIVSVISSRALSYAPGRSREAIHATSPGSFVSMYVACTAVASTRPLGTPATVMKT